MSSCGVLSCLSSSIADFFIYSNNIDTHTAITRSRRIRRKSAEPVAISDHWQDLGIDSELIIPLSQEYQLTPP